MTCQICKAEIRIIDFQEWEDYGGAPLFMGYSEKEVCDCEEEIPF